MYWSISFGAVCRRRIIEFEVKLLLVAVMKFLARLPLPGNGNKSGAKRSYKLPASVSVRLAQYMGMVPGLEVAQRIRMRWRGPHQCCQEETINSLRRRKQKNKLKGKLNKLDRIGEKNCFLTAILSFKFLWILNFFTLRKIFEEHQPIQKPQYYTLCYYGFTFFRGSSCGKDSKSCQHCHTCPHVMQPRQWICVSASPLSPSWLTASLI